MHKDKKDRKELFVTARRVDGAWRVVASDDELEHTHRQPFHFRDDAWALVREIRAGLDSGEDLDLRRWDSEALSDGHFC